MRPDVAGNSLGGWVALELGRSDAVKSVTAIAPAGLWPGPLLPKPSVAHRLARDVHAARRPARRHPVGTPPAAVRLGRPSERVPAAASAHLVRTYGRAPGFTAVNRAMRAGRFTDLEEIAVPVTLVWPRI